MVPCIKTKTLGLKPGGHEVEGWRVVTERGGRDEEGIGSEGQGCLGVDSV